MNESIGVREEFSELLAARDMAQENNTPAQAVRLLLNPGFQRPSTSDK